MSLALHYWMWDVHHCSGPPSPKWPILCRVGRLTLLYHTIPGTWSFSHQIWYTRWLLRSVSDFEATWCGVGIVFTLKHEACSCRAWTCVGEGAGWSAVCGGVYITDPVLVDLGYDHVAFHREVKNLRISIFQLLRLHSFTQIGWLYRIAENNSEISLKLFRQRAPNTF